MRRCNLIFNSITKILAWLLHKGNAQGSPFCQNMIQKSLSLWMFGRNQLPLVSATLFNRFVWLIESHLWYGSFLQKKKILLSVSWSPTPNQTEAIAAFKIPYKNILLKIYDLLSLQCHTITSRKQEAKITGLFLSCYCRQDTSTCKGEGDTKILEKLQNYILFTSMATDTKIHTVFSWSWCTCHYTAPVLWSSPVIQISYQSTIPYCGKN